MAIREIKGRKSPWQVYYNNPLTGKRESRNFLTRGEAEKEDSLIKHRIRFERESFYRGGEEENEKQNVCMTLEACYLLYLREKKFSKQSLQWQMKTMRFPLSKIGANPINELTREDIEKVLDAMLKWDVKPVTVREYLKVLRTVLNWCRGKGFCEYIDFPKLPPAKYERFIPPTPEELRDILSNSSPHIVRVVIIGSQFGVRVGASELLKLTWEDVDMDRHVLRIHGARKNINAQWREVPIRSSLLQIFQKWMDEDEKLGVSYLIHFNGKPIKNIWRAWRNTLRRAGITRRVRPYDLRHAFGTEMIAAGVDVGTVASLMGHSNPTMLLTHYQYVMDKQKKAAVEAIPDVPACEQVTYWQSLQ